MKKIIVYICIFFISILFSSCDATNITFGYFIPQFHQMVWGVEGPFKSRDVKEDNTGKISLTYRTVKFDLKDVKNGTYKGWGANTTAGKYQERLQYYDSFPNNTTWEFDLR